MKAHRKKQGRQRKQRGKQCRKVGYKSKTAARKALKEFGKARGCTRFYLCHFHAKPLWHLTSEK